MFYMIFFVLLFSPLAVAIKLSVVLGLDIDPKFINRTEMLLQLDGADLDNLSIQIDRLLHDRTCVCGLVPFQIKK